MTIKELEEATGMERAKIRFYEKEGFLMPSRLENGYRDYSVGEVELLLKIKLLRNLQMPLEEIRALMDGRELLGNALTKKIEELEQEKEMLSAVQEVCHTMKEEQESFASLKAEKYLVLLEQIAAEHGRNGTGEWSPPPRIYAPYRRRFARMMDYMITVTLCLAFLVLVLHINLAATWEFSWIIVVLVAPFLTLAIEPYLLHYFATTPGKAIFGMRIRKVDGGKLTVSEGRTRIFEMLSTDLLNIFSRREWADFTSVFWDRSGQWDLPWEKHNHAYTIKDVSLLRSLAYIALMVLLYYFSGCLIYYS